MNLIFKRSETVLPPLMDEEVLLTGVLKKDEEVERACQKEGGRMILSGLKNLDLAVVRETETYLCFRNREEAHHN